FTKNQYMNQLLRWLPFLALALILSACGGGDNSTSVGAPAAVALGPSTVSLDFGQVTSLSVTVTDAKGTAILTVTPTFQSSNTAVASVSTSGLVCAGTWDSLTTPVVCTPATTAGTANITATAGGITSAATVVSVHPRIASVNIIINLPTGQTCTSDAMTTQLSIKALNSAGVDITSTVGTPGWTSTNTNVVTIDVN